MGQKIKKKTTKIKKKHFVHRYSAHIIIITSLAVLIGVIAFFVSSKSSIAACNVASPTTAAGYEKLLRGSINGKWYHGDYGQSIVLTKGLTNIKVLWLFSDTFIGKAGNSRAGHAINNMALLTENGCVAAITGPLGKDGKETAWIRPNAVTDDPTKSGDYYWLSSPFIDKSTLNVFLLHMYNDSNGFHPIGVDLATFNIVGNEFKLKSISLTPGSNAYGTLPLWGAAVLQEGDYLYILGSQNKGNAIGHYYYLARAKTSQVTDIKAWSYWTGSTWSSSQKDIKEIISGSAGLATNVSLFSNTTSTKTANKRFFIVSKKGDAYFGKNLVAWKAQALGGPWTEISPALLAIPMPTPPMTASDVSYLGLAHPWASLSSGKMLVSWSLNSLSSGFWGDSRYGVRFSEVSKAFINSILLIPRR